MASQLRRRCSPNVEDAAVRDTPHVLGCSRTPTAAPELWGCFPCHALDADPHRDVPAAAYVQSRQLPWPIPACCGPARPSRSTNLGVVQSRSTPFHPIAQAPAARTLRTRLVVGHPPPSRRARLLASCLQPHRPTVVMAWARPLSLVSKRDVLTGSGGGAVAQRPATGCRRPALTRGGGAGQTRGRCRPARVRGQPRHAAGPTCWETGSHDAT